MLLETTLETFQALDNAYEAIAKEVKEARGAGAAPAWRSIVRERPRRPPGMNAADIECAKHGSMPHGIAYDALTDHLASEMAVWTRLSEHSKTAREVLGVSNVLPQSGSRLGALVYMDENRALRVRFAGSAGVLSLSSDAADLWVEGLMEATSFRPKHELSDPHLFYSREGGKARRWSFSDVKKGYEEYLRAHQKPADETALASLATCPTPRLLGGLTEHNRRAFKEQMPLALSEAWLFGGGQNQNGSLCSTCDACRFGLGPWMCGHRDMLSRAEAANPLHYNEAARQWVDRIRDRREKGAHFSPTGESKGEPSEGPKTISDRPGFWTGDTDPKQLT
ncbi:MAG: hypothetical protein IPK82_16695 [Polyangiaceae bacterium]|nr:hypothetical protein [Polyangiaceae bacterium]